MGGKENENENFMIWRVDGFLLGVLEGSLADGVGGGGR